ncbi:unnamed protein product [Sphagnum jensenii]|uniref:Uncharacterized protein n=1 Tax=Sphagnum jensenii TaxID=128206 RepID=A0ABP1AC55_9BRYO
MLNTSLESPLIVVFTPTYHSFGKVTLCLNSYKEVMKVEGGTLQMASTLISVTNFMELIQGEVITWRSLALVVTTLNNSQNKLIPFSNLLPNLVIHVGCAGLFSML